MTFPAYTYDWGSIWIIHFSLVSRGGHYIVKLRITWEQKKSTFSKLHHQNGSKFYQIFFMSRYTWYLLHGKN